MPKCKHPEAERIAGGYDGEVLPRYPLRFGSAEVEACGACGEWRMPHHGNGKRWYPGPYDIAYAEAVAAQDDEC